MDIFRTEEWKEGENQRNYFKDLVKLITFKCGPPKKYYSRSLKSYFFESSKTYNRMQYEQISESKFIQWSTILIVLNYYCKCYSHVLDNIQRCIRGNKYLRYKSILIMLNRYTLCKRCSLRYKRNPLWFKDFVYIITTQNTFTFKDTKSSRKKIPVCYDNIIIMDIDFGNELDEVYCHVLVGFWERNMSNLTIQQAVKYSHGVSGIKLRASTAADIYFFAINPALAVIINNYHFTPSNREGSELDVAHLIRELKIAQIPYIVEEDCNRYELLQVIDFLQKTNFGPLKTLLVFLMSHGEQDDVFKVRDGKLNIKRDIIHRIQSNKSLKNAEKLILANCCRGPIDMEFGDTNDLMKIKPTTELSHLKDKTMAIYSVPDLTKSPRCPSTGSPFINGFCQFFRNIYATTDIRTVAEKIDNYLKKVWYYQDQTIRSELLINDNKPHRIMQKPVNAIQMYPMLQYIANSLPVREDIDRRLQLCHYVGGSLKLEQHLQLYCAPELDNDECSMDAYEKYHGDDS